MKHQLALYLFLVLTAVASQTFAQLPPGYSKDSVVVVLPESLEESLLGGRFHISIMRRATTARECELLAIAESAIPPKDSIETAESKVTGEYRIRAIAEARLRPGARWWWRKWDDIWLPYSLTGSAVAEYMEHVRMLSRSPNPYAQHNPGVAHRASLKYTAEIKALPGGIGHRAVLSVTYTSYCGSLCALTFSHRRVVVFDAEGRVVRIEGDGPPFFGAA